MSTHSFYFKLAYTCQTINYDINLDMPIREFINYVKEKIRIDFNIDNNYDIEIVESGQFNNVNGRNAELAPALEATTYTILQTYGDNYKQTAFYIRKINRHLRIIIPDYLENDDCNIPNAPRGKY